VDHTRDEPSTDTGDNVIEEWKLSSPRTTWCSNFPGQWQQWKQLNNDGGYHFIYMQF
jgi:hypothetical protein